MCAARSDATGQRQTLTVLLLPGMDGTGELLAALVGRLSLYRPVQVIAYPAKPRGYDDLVDFVVSRAPKERFVIVGESFLDRSLSSCRLVVSHGRARARVQLCASSDAIVPCPTGPDHRSRMGSQQHRSRHATSVDGNARTQGASDPSVGPPAAKLIRVGVRKVLRVDKRDRLREVRCPMLCLQGGSIVSSEKNPQ